MKFDLLWIDPNNDLPDMNAGLPFETIIDDTEQDVEWQRDVIGVGEEFDYINHQGLTITARRVA